ncbi:MAG: hypothetical protein ACRDT6_26645, partial [Micromonosporaceae bacterium]
AGRGAPGRQRWVRLTVAALLPLLVAGQALTLAVPYWPRVDRDTFYPMTDTHRFLAEHLGHERFAGSSAGMYVGADSGARLRALSGHFFLNGRFAETIDGLPGQQFGDPPTYVNFPAEPAVVRQPVLDRLAVRYFVVSPGVAPFGEQRVEQGDASTATLRPGTPLRVRVPGEGGAVRGIGLVLAAPFRTDPHTRVDLALYDDQGNRLASSRRLLYDLGAGEPFWIPVAGENIPDHELLTAELTLHADTPLSVAGVEGRPAVSTVLPADDGMLLAYAGSAVVYQRLTALPRIHWASRTVYESDPRRRVELVASGELAPDQVLLDEPAGGSDGAPAAVRVVRDDTDQIEVTVDAAGAGHLVIADALQQDWAASVDGRPARLVPADHGLVAVAVPQGRHTVRVAYQLPYGGLGSWVSGLTVVLVFVLLGAGWWIRRGSGQLAENSAG